VWRHKGKGARGAGQRRGGRDDNDGGGRRVGNPAIRRNYSGNKIQGFYWKGFPLPYVNSTRREKVNGIDTAVKVYLVLKKKEERGFRKDEALIEKSGMYTCKKRGGKNEDGFFPIGVRGGRER